MQILPVEIGFISYTWSFRERLADIFLKSGDKILVALTGNNC